MKNKKDREIIAVINTNTPCDMPLLFKSVSVLCKSMPLFSPAKVYYHFEKSDAFDYDSQYRIMKVEVRGWKK